MPKARDTFALVAACAMWPPSERRDEAVRTAAARVEDWDYFLRMARRHRVGGLAHHGLTAAGVALPPPVTEVLDRVALSVAARSRALAQESARLQSLLDGEQIPNLILKGAPLSALAYGDAPVKSAWDIDIVTQPSAVSNAIDVLKNAGYALYSPTDLPSDRVETYVALARECILVHQVGRIFVELKWTLDQNPAILPGLSRLDAVQTVAFGEGVALRTLEKDALFSYLCVHGARHGFSRLKWLADIAALIAREPGEEIERLYCASQALGAHRSSAQALLLCERLLATPLPPDLSAELKTDAITRWLVSMAVITMAGGDGVQEIEARRFATARILFAHLLLGRTRGYLMAELGLKWVSPRDRLELALPPWAGFLYPLMRAPRSLWRRVTLR